VISAGPALRRLLVAFEKLGIACFAGGSLASSVHGIPRATRDIDLIARIAAIHVEDLARELEGEFYADPEMIREALVRGRPFNVIHFESGYKFDVFPLKNDPFEAEEFRRRQFQAVPQLGEGLSLPIASAEDIVLSKLAWYRQGGEISERQWTDARGVVEVQGQRLDLGYLREWAPKLGVVDLLERLLAQSGHQ
jgi:hypothetical protein